MKLRVVELVAALLRARAIGLPRGTASSGSKHMGWLSYRYTALTCPTQGPPLFAARPATAATFNWLPGKLFAWTAPSSLQ